MFVTDHAAMKIGKSLVIADLHIGIEHEIMKSGIRVRQVDDLIERASDLLRITKTKSLVILGDLKHNVPMIRYEEKRSVPAFLEEVGKKARITIVPGNHDGSLKSLCPGNVKICKSSGILIGKYGLLHGHARPSEEVEKKAKIIVTAHNHPLFMFKDSGGARFYRQVWVRGNSSDGKEMVIMPAFSRLVGGAAFNKIKTGRALMGPVAKKIDIRNAEIHMLDGTLIGRLGDISRRVLT